MKASELIAKLAAAITEGGDVNVMIPDSGCGCCASDRGEDIASVTFEAEHVDDWHGLGFVPARIFISE